MNHNQPHSPRRASSQGVTLLEMTVVIAVLMVLIAIGLAQTSAYDDWKQAKTASESLREVYTAQKHYLADHPRTNVADLTADDIVPYLRNGLTAIPTVEGLDGTTYTIKVDVTPPVIDNGTGGVYDPSERDDDGLWDVGL